MFLLHETVSGCKRQRADLDTIEPESSAAKRPRSDQNQRKHWNPGPRFWDTLSILRLTRGALTEFERRSKQRSEDQRSKPNRRPVAKSRPLTRLRVKQLQSFTSKGGPDLSHLRGFATSPATMSRSSSRYTKDSKASRTTNTSRSTPYNLDYEQKLKDSGVYPHNRISKPSNRAEILNDLQVVRPSLSPSRFDDDDFEKFQELCEEAKGETKVMRDVMSVIEGKSRYTSSADVCFVRAESIAQDIAAAKPDLYDGVSLDLLDPRLRTDLSRHIVPSADTSEPAAPNFFTEGKSAKGRADVAKLQACHDGAIGARAMHALQNYGAVEPSYDGNAYSFSSTYHDGTLKLYATHPTAPSSVGGKPQYHMTQLRSFAMTDSRESFQKGAAAYRNARDLAASHRASFVEQANDVARRLPAPTTSSLRDPDTDSETSLDELAREEVTVKRTKRAPAPNRGRISVASSAQMTSSRQSHPRRSNQITQVESRQPPSELEHLSSQLTHASAKKTIFRGCSGREVELGGKKWFIAEDRWEPGIIDGCKVLIYRKLNIWCGYC